MGLAVGTAVSLGGGIAYLLGVAFRRGAVPEFLKAPVVLVAVLSVYGLSSLVHEESGLMAATLLGLVLANLRLPSIRDLRRFNETLTVLLVSGIFILLSADLNVATLTRLDWHSAGLLVAIVLFTRPVAVLLATAGAGMPRRERVPLAWVAPRGIVAAATAGLFGPCMISSGYRDAVGTTTHPCLKLTARSHRVVYTRGKAVLPRQKQACSTSFPTV
jgi:NhaP-type Na+/H+ or K+/H+ antiporter